jgi:hypothetical protein
MAKYRRGTNWASGRGAEIRPDEPTGFDVKVQKLGLNSGNWASSEELRKWCEQNKNHCYIPEQVLKRWKIVVNGD